MALFVALGHPDCFVQLAFAQGAGHNRGKLSRLLAGGAESDPAVDHDADRPCGHDEKNDDDGLRHPAHLFPQVNRVPAYAGIVRLKEPEGEQVRFGKRESCNIGDKHEFKFSSSELFRTFAENLGSWLEREQHDQRDEMKLLFSWAGDGA